MKPVFDKQAYDKQHRIDHRNEGVSVSDSNAAYRANHRDETRAYNAAYYAAHRDERIAHQAAYYQDHRAERDAYSSAYRASHKEERSAYDVSYYQENGDALRERDRGKCAEFTEWLQIFRSINGCEDRGTHEGRLEHHHIDPSTKRYSISEMYSCSLDTLEEEMEKCVVLCVACHSKRHVALRANARVAA